MLGLTLIVIGGAVVVYASIGYPVLLSGLALVTRRDRAKPERTGESELPPISITVPVFNEVHQIDALLASLVALEYPRERRQILVVSDGSTDGTDDAVREWADQGVELLRVTSRGGKGAAENEARRHLTGEIVVNTDASIRIRPDALEPLIRPFADPSVGVVSGRDLSVTSQAGDANTGEGGYVGYEMTIRDLETRSGGIVGASGCFYAIRRELHLEEVPPELSRDFASALIARDRDYRAVSAPDAVCFVPRTTSLGKEYRRKVRTLARGMATLGTWRHLLNPFRVPAFAWKLFSHKVCRWATPLALLLVGTGLALLAPTHGWARGVLALAAVVVALGAVGWILSRRDRPLPRLLAVTAFFVMSNVAVLHALMRALRGGSEPVWEPTRRGSPAG